MIAFHDRAFHFSHARSAFVRVRVVTNDVAQTNIIGAFAIARVGHYGLEGLEIGVNITDYRETHWVETALLCAVWNSLILCDIQFLFENFQSLN